MMSSKNNGFTASDIERYHSGKMSPDERHALEKAALDDPFLADALEGYAFTSTPSDDLAKIQSRLEEKLNRKKVIPIFQRYKWMSVAAIILIIAGAGWFAYTISQRPTNASVTAMEKKLPDKDSNSIAASPQNNLHGSANNKTTSAKLAPAEQNKQTITVNKAFRADEGSLSLKSKQQLNRSDDKKIIVPDNAETVSKATSIPSIQNEVASANNNQRAYTNMNNSVPVEPRWNSTSNDVKRKELFYNKADTNNNLTGRVRGVNTNDSIKDLTIVLKPLPADSLKEIVVGYGKLKKSTEKYPHVIIDTLEPEEGYVHFDDYIADNLKMPEEIKDKPVSGEVQLSFDVGKDGQPTNITVVKSLCGKCDEEAIRLLKEGPRWKKKKNKKGKITIKF